MARGNHKAVAKSEAAFQKDLLVAINIPGISYFRKTPSGSMAIGLPDLMGCVLGRMVALELKVFPKVVSERQEEELKRFTRVHAYTAVVTLAQLKGEFVCIVCPTQPNPSGDPIVQTMMVNSLEETPWLNDENLYRAYELPFVRVKGHRAINPIKLINRIADREVLESKKEQSNGDE